MAKSRWLCVGILADVTAGTGATNCINAVARWVDIIIIWLLHNLVEASFDLFRYLLLGDQLRPWELHPLVS